MAYLMACAMQMSSCNPNGIPEYMTKTGNTLADGHPVRQQPKQLREFKIKGHTVMAYSRKDAIKRLKRK